jgi:hypothetical protein
MRLELLDLVRFVARGNHIMGINREVGCGSVSIVRELSWEIS